MAYEVVPCLYNTEKDLQARLDRTICRYDNTPYYVVVAGAKTIHLWNPQVIKGQSTKKTDPELVIKPDDPLFDISSPELGYMNYNYSKESEGDRIREAEAVSKYGNLALYVKRSPCRQWKQGLHYDTINHSSIEGHTKNYGLSQGAIFYSHGLSDLVKNSYPALPLAVHTLSRMEDMKYKQMAVSKEVAIEKTDSDIIQVYVKRANVGYILPGERTIHVKKEKNSWVTRKILESLKTSVV